MIGTDQKPFNELFNGDIRMNLKQRRKAKGWTQEDVAKKIGVLTGTYGAYETGRIAMPPDIQKRLEKVGLGGPWPREEANGATAPAAPTSGLAEEVVKLKGRVEALEGQLLAALVAAKTLDERLQRIERQ